MPLQTELVGPLLFRYVDELAGSELVNVEVLIWHLVSAKISQRYPAKTWWRQTLIRFETDGF